MYLVQCQACVKFWPYFIIINEENQCVRFTCIKQNLNMIILKKNVLDKVKNSPPKITKKARYIFKRRLKLNTFI